MPSANNSLRDQLLRRMLLVLLPTLIVGCVLSYFLAARGVIHAFELGLLDDATDLARQLRQVDGHTELSLPPDASQMLTLNNDDSVRYAIWDRHGGLIAGDPALVNPWPLGAGHTHEFREIELADVQYRAALWRGSAQDVYIAVAQTTNGLDRILRDIFASVVFLGTLIAAMSLIGMAVGIRRGLRPVDTLSAEILSRSPAALQPLHVGDVPQELLPVVHSINELLASLDLSLERHRHFIASAAHQLRTPLAILSTQLELGLKEQPRECRDVLQRLLITVRRASHLSSQLLSLARLESTDEDETPMQPVALADVIRAAVAIHIVAAEKRHIELNFHVDAARVRGQELLLEEMIGNLLDNAINYAGEGAEINISSVSANGRVALTVADNGPGASAQTLAALGNPFFRGDAADSKGSGLGLVIVKEIVRLHHGTLRFRSGEGGRGLVIEIQLPAL